MSQKNQKTNRKSDRIGLKIEGLEMNTEPTNVLRTVSDREAFYFYEAIGKPTGENAKSLNDFLRKTKSVRLESLLFHLQRKDFQNWVKNTLGDSKLAARIGRIRASQSNDLRAKIHSTIEKRIKELQEASLRLSLNENLTVRSSTHTS